MNQNSLAYELPTKGQSTPDIKLHSKYDNGGSTPGSAGEKTTRANSTVQKQGTLLNWLKESKSAVHLQTNATRDTGTEAKAELETETKTVLGKDTKRDIRTDTA